MTDATPPTYQGQPQPYGQPQYGQPSAYGPKTNVLAVISMVASLAGLVVFLLGPIAGVITGHIANGQIKQTGEGGHGLALAGVILGIVFSLFWVVYFVVIIGALIFSSAATASLSGY